jgi:hypothetical protein
MYLYLIVCPVYKQIACNLIQFRYVRRCIQKFPDWVDNEINNSNYKHSLRSNTKGYGGKTH